MNILYISSGKPTFVRKDISLLSLKYNVDTLHYGWNHINIPLNIIKQFIHIALRIKKIDTIIVMFAGYWSVLPVLFGKFFKKNVFIILGGTDCVSYPTINYGSLRKPLLKSAIYISLKNATCLLPVHESLIDFTNSYFDHSKQGIKNHFKSIKTPVRTIFNGYEPKATQSEMESSIRIPNSFITVAFVNDNVRMMIKGIDLIIESACEFPEANFTIIGFNKKFKKQIKTPYNVTLNEPIQNNELNQKYIQSEFVINISISEGFPNALCEAMSFGCIPIISPVGAMPAIVQNAGFTIQNRNRIELSNAIKEALNLTPEQKATLRQLAYAQIKNNFNITQRMSKFMQTLEEFERKN